MNTKLYNLTITHQELHLLMAYQAYMLACLTGDIRSAGEVLTLVVELHAQDMEPPHSVGRKIQALHDAMQADTPDEKHRPLYVRREPRRQKSGDENNLPAPGSDPA